MIGHVQVCEHTHAPPHMHTHTSWKLCDQVSFVFLNVICVRHIGTSARPAGLKVRRHSCGEECSEEWRIKERRLGIIGYLCLGNWKKNCWQGGEFLLFFIYVTVNWTPGGGQSLSSLWAVRNGNLNLSLHGFFHCKNKEFSSVFSFKHSPTDHVWSCFRNEYSDNVKISCERFFGFYLK